MKRTLLFSFISILLLLSACTGSPFTTSRNIIQDYNTGTEGLTLEFVPQAPPQTIYEGGEFDVQVRVTNKGAFDLTDEYAATVRLREPDSTKVIKMTDNAALAGSYVQDQAIQLAGKSLSYPDGESRNFALERYQAQGISGNFQTNTANFNVELCYPYQTSFSDNVCIDTNIDGNDLRRQSCQAQDKTYGGGQGGPLAVVAIETEMVPRGVYIEPQFVIHVEHVGDGRVEYAGSAQSSGPTGVLASLFGSTQTASTCEEATAESINKFSLVARLGGQELDCDSSEELYLRDDKAKVYCRLASTQVLASSASYTSILEVDLQYQYREDFSTKTTITRSGLFTFTGPRESQAASTADDCYPWEEYANVDGKQVCISNCRYLAQQGNAAALQSLTDSPYATSQLVEYVDCVYNSAEACRAADDLCVYEQNLCAPGSYCGFPSCVEKNSLPRILDIVNPDPMTVQWFCSDRDDETDPKGTCGCTDTAYYAFVSKDAYSSCDTVPASEYNFIDGNKDSFMTSYEVSLAQGNEDTWLCIKVEDRLGATKVQRLRYPYNRFG